MVYVSYPGAVSKANVGISNDKEGEIPSRCKTIRVFNLYREYLEDEISKHKDIRFENYSKTGAKIKGAILV